MNVHYAVESGKLVARDPTTQNVVWINDFGGYPVIKLLPLLDEGDCLILLDPGASKQPTFENLLRVKSDGSIVWRADLPQTHDTYSDILWRKSEIEGRTWLGTRVLVNLSNGKTQKIGFSK